MVDNLPARRPTYEYDGLKRLTRSNTRIYWGTSQDPSIPPNAEAEKRNADALKTASNPVLRSALATVLVAVTVGCSTQRPEKREGMAQRVIGVCEALKNYKLYRGRMVTIRGVYFNGLQDRCDPPLTTGAHSWPPVIGIVISNSAAGTDRGVPFNTDMDNWYSLDRLVVREAKAGRREEIWVSITGMFHAPKSYVREDGQIVGGYGHLGMYPAEFVIQRVSEIQIKNTQTTRNF